MTNAELAILGLIVEKPRHGYAIEGVIEERNMRDWTELGFSSIYYILNKLEEEGLIVSQLEKSEGRGPARKVYAITEAGQAAWYQATLDSLSQPAPPPPSFLLGLVGLPAIPRQEAVRALEQYREEVAQRRERVWARWQEAGGDKLPLFLIGMFEYSVKLAQAEIDWLEDFIAKLAAEGKPTGEANH